MPQIVAQALPWVRLDLRRVYAIGGSMGGQETLLLLGRHPELLAGLLIRRIRALQPRGPLEVHTGTWTHTRPLRWDRRLPQMLVGLGLLPAPAR